MKKIFASTVAGGLFMAASSSMAQESSPQFPVLSSDGASTIYDAADKQERVNSYLIVCPAAIKMFMPFNKGNEAQVFLYNTNPEVATSLLNKYKGAASNNSHIPLVNAGIVNENNNIIPHYTVSEVISRQTNVFKKGNGGKGSDLKNPELLQCLHQHTHDFCFSGS